MSMTATLHAPALSASNRPSGLLLALREALHRHRQREAALRLERQLAGMTEHTLRDIGMRRDQIADVVNAHRLGASVSLPL